MAGDFVSANFGGLSEGQAAFTQAYNGLVSTVDSLQQQLQGNLSDWVGSAQTAYTEAHAIWTQAIGDMGAVITGMSSVIGDANANYQLAESTNSRMFT
jgi:WXG100 family type VII secretion target